MTDPIPFDPADEPYVSLATFRRNGAAVKTPVWIAEHDNTLYVFSAEDAGKVKRLGNSGKIQLAACDARGNVRGPWIDGEAYLTDDPDEISAMYPSFIRKYGWQMSVGNFFSRITGRFHKRAIIGIRRDSLDYQTSPLSYIIDADDRVIAVNDAWHKFGRENGLTTTILGQSIWQFVGGSDVAHIYRLILTRVRDSGKTMKFQFRCDAPGVERHMEMHMTPVADNMVEFQTITLNQKKRKSIDLLNKDHLHSDALLTICSWCTKAFVDETWIELAEATDQLGLLSHGPIPMLTHSICSDCHKSLSAELALDS